MIRASTFLSSWEERNLENGKKCRLVRIMNNVGLNSTNIVNSVRIFNVCVAMNNFKEYCDE